MPITLCLSPRCWINPDTRAPEPWEAAPGLRLCWGCRDRLADHLDQLPGLYAELEDALAAATGGTNERVSGTADRALPVNPAAVEARDRIRTVLATWTGLVLDERGVTGPTRDVEVLAAFLARQADWLAAHPAAGDVADEVTDLVHIARRVARPDPQRRLPLGACLAPGCPGALAAVLRARDAARPSALHCDTDPEHTWPAAQWLSLRRVVRGRS